MTASGIWMLASLLAWGIATNENSSDTGAGVAALFAIAALVVSIVLAITAI